MEQKGKVEIILTADNSNFNRNMDGAKGQFDGLKQSALSLKGAIGGVFAGLSVGMLVGEIKSTYQAAEESDKIFRQVAQTIKASGDAAGLSAEEISNMASAMMELTGVDDDVIMGAQNILLTFRNIGRDVFPQATQAVMDMATTMGTDLNSAALQLGKALNDPIEGLTALRRVGVAFTNEQEDMIKALVKSGRGMEAQKIILNELTKEFGGAAAAAKTASQELETSFGEMQESIGRFFTGGVGEKFTNWLNDMVKGFTKIADNIRIFTSEVEKLNATDLNQRLSANRDQQKEIKNNPLYKMGDPWVKEDLAKLIKEEKEIQSRIEKLKSESANKKGGKPPVFNPPSEKDDSEKEAEKAYRAAIEMIEAKYAKEIAMNEYTGLQVLGKQREREEEKLKIMEQYGKKGSADYLQQEASIADAKRAIERAVNKDTDEYFDRSLKYRIAQGDMAREEELNATIANEQAKLAIYKQGTDEWLKQYDRVIDARKNLNDYIKDKDKEILEENKKTQEEIKNTGDRYGEYISGNLRRLAEGTTSIGNLIHNVMLDFAEMQIKSGISSLYQNLFSPQDADSISGWSGGISKVNKAGGFLNKIGDWFGGEFAEGGNPPVGVPYLVGERGPELRIDRTPSTIIPNNKLSIGGQGQGDAYIYAPQVQIQTAADASQILSAMDKHKSSFFGWIKQNKKRDPNIF